MKIALWLLNEKNLWCSRFNQEMKYFFTIIPLLFITQMAFAQMSIADYNNAVEQMNIAKEFMEVNDYPQAIVHLENAIEYDTTLRVAYMLLYEAGYTSGNTNVSRNYLIKAKSIFQEDDEIIYYLAKVYQKEGNYLAALNEFTEAIKYAKINGDDLPFLYDYYASRGVCYLKKNSYQDALDDFDYALKLNEMEGSIYVNRGYALYKLSRTEEGCESWSKAFDLGHTYVNQYLDKYCK